MSSPRLMFRAFAQRELDTAQAQARTQTQNQLQNVRLPSVGELRAELGSEVAKQKQAIASGIPGVPQNVKGDLATLAGLTQVSDSAAQLVTEYAGPLALALGVSQRFLGAVFSITGSNADNFLYWRGRRSLPDQYLTYRLFDQLKDAGFSPSQARQINAAAKEGLRPILEVIGASEGKQAQNAMRKWYNDTPIYGWWRNEEEADRLERSMELRFQDQAQPFLDLTIAAALQAATPQRQTNTGGAVIGFPQRSTIRASDFRIVGFKKISFKVAFAVPENMNFQISQSPSISSRINGFYSGIGSEMPNGGPIPVVSSRQLNILLRFGASGSPTGPLKEHVKTFTFTLTNGEFAQLGNLTSLQVNVVADITGARTARYVGSGTVNMAAYNRARFAPEPRPSGANRSQRQPVDRGRGTVPQGDYAPPPAKFDASKLVIPAAALIGLKVFNVI